MNNCEYCKGTGLGDDSSEGDYGACEECQGTGRAAQVPPAQPAEPTDLEWFRLPEIFGKFVDYAQRPVDENALRIIRAVAERQQPASDTPTSSAEPVATITVFMDKHDMGQSLAPNPPFKSSRISYSWQRAEALPLGEYPLFLSQAACNAALSSSAEGAASRVPAPFRVSVSPMQASNGVTYVVSLERGDRPAEARAWDSDGLITPINRNDVEEANDEGQRWADFLGASFTPCKPVEGRLPNTVPEYGGSIAPVPVPVVTVQMPRARGLCGEVFWCNSPVWDEEQIIAALTAAGVAVRVEGGQP